MAVDLLDLATEIANIARTARDAETGEKLMKLADRLLSDAGLPAAHNGGGLIPTRRFRSGGQPRGGLSLHWDEPVPAPTGGHHGSAAASIPALDNRFRAKIEMADSQMPGGFNEP